MRCRRRRSRASSVSGGGARQRGMSAVERKKVGGRERKLRFEMNLMTLNPKSQTLKDVEKMSMLKSRKIYRNSAARLGPLPPDGQETS